MIKFRCWSPQYKMMFEVAGIYWYQSTYSVTCDTLDDDIEFEADEIELMQSTQLLDKNGVEIFEGDILTYDFVGGVETYIIERSPDDNQLYVKYAYLGSDIEYIGEGPIEGSIIVGDRWANPELIQGDEE